MTYKGFDIAKYDDGCPGTRYVWSNEDTGQESDEAFDTVADCKRDIDSSCRGD